MALTIVWWLCRDAERIKLMLSRDKLLVRTGDQENIKRASDFKALNRHKGVIPADFKIDIGKIYAAIERDAVVPCLKAAHDCVQLKNGQELPPPDYVFLSGGGSQVQPIPDAFDKIAADFEQQTGKAIKVIKSGQPQEDVVRGGARFMSMVRALPMPPAHKPLSCSSSARACLCQPVSVGVSVGLRIMREACPCSTCSTCSTARAVVQKARNVVAVKERVFLALGVTIKPVVGNPHSFLPIIEVGTVIPAVGSCNNLCFDTIGSTCQVLLGQSMTRCALCSFNMFSNCFLTVL